MPALLTQNRNDYMSLIMSYFPAEALRIIKESLKYIQLLSSLVLIKPSFCSPLIFSFNSVSSLFTLLSVKIICFSDNVFCFFSYSNNKKERTAVICTSCFYNKSIVYSNCSFFFVFWNLVQFLFSWIRILRQLIICKFSSFLCSLYVCYLCFIF